MYNFGHGTWLGDIGSDLLELLRIHICNVRNINYNILFSNMHDTKLQHRIIIVHAKHNNRTMYVHLLN